MIFKREPAMVRAVILAGIMLAMGFGLAITDRQLDLIMGFVGAVLALITGVSIRNNVTPVDKS